MKILEIDGGIASISGLVLETLTVNGPEGRTIPRFAQFDITNPDKFLLSTLEERMGSCGPRVSFKDLDVESDSGSFEEATYDLVVVCLVWLRSSHDPCLSCHANSPGFPWVCFYREVLEQNPQYTHSVSHLGYTHDTFAGLSMANILSSQ
jgi:hypothetical protein